MKNHQLILDRNRRRVKQCPCGGNNADGKFVPFKGHETKGYCHSCGKTFLPEQEEYILPQIVALPPVPTSYIDSNALAPFTGRNNYLATPFSTFLVSLFGEETARLLRFQYCLGTTEAGDMVFPLIDTSLRIRSAKVMRYKLIQDNAVYGQLNCKRDKTFNTWIHSILRLKDFHLRRCLFGLHLITEFSTRPLAIVESEKTALIASIYLPQFTWMATGGKGSLNELILDPVRNNQIVLFPDVNATEEWTAICKELSKRFNITVNRYLSNVTTRQEKELGLDLADFLIRYDHRTFGGAKKLHDQPQSAIVALRKLNDGTAEDAALVQLVNELGLELR
jgi:hypothetical protein